MQPHSAGSDRGFQNSGLGHREAKPAVGDEWDKPVGEEVDGELRSEDGGEEDIDLVCALARQFADITAPISPTFLCSRPLSQLSPR